jgi:tetratricopeptide (TPR) repeat protein
MAIDAYAPCPCGSGKKFKWCCQPIHVQIDKAFAQDQEGQHEAALRQMDDVTREHPANPEAWGRKAQLLYQNERVDDAENALQKALEINPNYAFGHLLRGMSRQHEGEIAGALILFRKAAELYDPEAKDVLVQVYSLIADQELKLHRPIAGKAALQICHRMRPSDEVRQALEQLFGDNSHYPLSARRDYTLRSLPAEAPEEKRSAWECGVAGAATGRLTDAAGAYEKLTQADGADRLAWYNLAVLKAWLGDNKAALEALDRYVTLEQDVPQAAEGWAMAEVLRFGQGMEDQADYVEHAISFQIRDPERVFRFAEDWQRERRLTGVQVRQEEGMISGIILERSGGLLTGSGATTQPARLGAYLIIFGHHVLVVRGLNLESLTRIQQELQERLGPALSEPRMQRGPANFGDVLAEALIFPLGTTDQAEAQKVIREHVQRFFEDTWIHRPLRALGNVPPVDATGHNLLRKKLLGVIQFIDECAQGETKPYDFDRLRHKLGLQAKGTAEAQAPAPTGPAPLDIDAMSAADLAGLNAANLMEDQLEQAHRAAQRLDAAELAANFARALVERPANANRPDRFPFYSYLIQRATAEGDSDRALTYVDEGEKADCEHNEGRRRNDYELRRAQVLAKRGESESAREVFERLIARVPSNLKYRGTAAESMLTLKQGTAALQFAEQGLSKARENNDRDSEQYFMELVAAARRQTG